MIQPKGAFALLAAALLGAVAAFGQAPYDLPLLVILSLVLLLLMYDPDVSPFHAAVFGWAFGTGYFLHALHWILSPFMVDADRHGWMAPFALIFLAAGLALFWGLAFWAARILTPGARWPLVLTLPAVELLRAYIFTGFPWAMPAQSLVDVLPGQALAWVGPYALNLLMVLVALLGAAALNRQNGLTTRILSGTLAIGAGYATFLPVPETPAALTNHTVRLVQPNAPQRDKWNPDKIPLFFDRQIGYTAATPESAPPDLVLWSETAIPWLLEYADQALIEIAAAGGEATVALGVQRRAEDNFYNSMIVLDRDGQVDQLYDKHHLVPFGEYIPFNDLIARIGLRGLAVQLGGGYAAGQGTRLLDFGALGQALPLICYEAVFPQDTRHPTERPDFLIQITNDAWFGTWAGPRQHLAQARMRAIEQGLPLARAANTGISAMIDPQGRILASLPLNSAGFVDAPLPAPAVPTLYSRMGDVPLVLLLLFGLATSAIAGRRV
ncbi:MAG: apolipoprotein N-acyltransferase [Sulfitobacter sp.]|nr:apolipoprotein N-acyltransferase [Sulfitobacter sp.]